MASITIVVATETAAVSAPNARAAMELAAYARAKGAPPGATQGELLTYALRHMLRDMVQVAQRQRRLDVVEAAGGQYDTDNPPQGDWS